MAMSSTRQLVSSTRPDARNSSADANDCAANPNTLSKSGSDSRTDSSSSTIDTSAAAVIPFVSSVARLSWRLLSGIMSHRSLIRPSYFGLGPSDGGAEHALPLAGNRERERRSRAAIARCPQTAAMKLHNRATDRKAHSHAAALGRVECVEQPVVVTGIEPGSCVTHAHVYLSSVGAGGDHQLPRTICDGTHRVACI